MHCQKTALRPKAKKEGKRRRLQGGRVDYDYVGGESVVRSIDDSGGRLTIALSA